MNVNELVKRILGRRIALALLALAVCGAALYGYSTGITVRQSSAAAVVVPPPTFSSTGDTLGANPVLNLSPEKAQLASILATTLLSEPAQQAVAAEAPGVEYTVSSTLELGINYQQPSPQLTITVLCSQKSDCQAGGRALINFARDSLVKLQVGASVAPENWASLTVLQDPTAPVVISNSAVKSAGSMAVAALVAGLILLLGYDALAARRRTKPTQDQKSAEPTQDAQADAQTTASTDAPAPDHVTSEPVTDAVGNAVVSTNGAKASDRETPQSTNGAGPDSSDPDGSGPDGTGQKASGNSTEDDLGGVEIDDETLAKAVLNWRPPRLTDFQSWRPPKP